MCRSKAEGGRRCPCDHYSAKGARFRQRRSRAARGLEAARATGNADAIASATAKYEAVFGELPPPATKSAPTTPAKVSKTYDELEQAAVQAVGARSDLSTQERIRMTVEMIQRHPGDWVGLVSVRKALGTSVTDAEYVEAMRDFARNNRNAVLIPESNRKALKDEDHASAVPFGGDQNHLIAIQKPLDPDVSTTAPTSEKPVPEPATPKTTTPKPDATKTGTTEDRIRAAWKSLATQQGDWIRIARIREAVGGDVTHDEVTQVLTDMMRRGGVHLAPDSNRKVLTEDDHKSAVKLGGEDKHLVAIEPPCIPGAADHVRAIGIANATDDELENGLNAPEITGALYDEIRAEQRRRR